MSHSKERGCLTAVFTMGYYLFLIIAIGVCKFLLPENIARYILPFIIATFISIIVAGNIYRIIMKRYHVLAPDNPYEYNKMAEVSFTKDEVNYIKKSVKF